MMDDSSEELYMHSESRYFGKYRGTVVDNNDPMHRGRLLISCGSVLGKTEVWALPCVPYAGKERGMLFLPEKGTQVWVEFEAGDTCFPIWSGCFWGKDDIPPADHSPDVKLIKTEKIEIRIDDANNKITIKNSYGTLLEIHGGKIVGKANSEIVHQVKTMKAALDVTKFDVHDGALSVS